MPRAALQGHKYIAQRSGTGRTDDPDPARKAGYGAFALCGKQAFGLQLHLQPGKGFEQTTQPGAAQGFDGELEFATGFVERDQGMGFDLLPVFQAPGNRICT